MTLGSDWHLHLKRWVIEDGSPELHVGDVFDWPVTFLVDEVLSPARERTKSASLLAGDSYRVNAEVMYISHDPDQAGCILDFGIWAISEDGGLVGVPIPPKCNVGDYVTGEVRLNLALCTVVHPHDLSCNWRVEGIFADLGVFSEPRYQEVSGTDAVRAVSYVLQCSSV